MSSKPPQPPQFDAVNKKDVRQVRQPLQEQSPSVNIHRDAISLRNWEVPSEQFQEQMRKKAVIDCGWGRVIFAHTFDKLEQVAKALQKERSGSRDLALYLRDPHVLLASAPQELFLDPSHTFRLNLNDLQPLKLPTDIVIRRARWKKDAKAMKRLFLARHMVPVEEDYVLEKAESNTVFYLVAEHKPTKQIVGTVTGIDHSSAFNDPEQGSSLWTLAVDPQSPWPGVGQALISYLATFFAERSAKFMDLSVLAENDGAIRLYEKLGFHRVPVFCVKRRQNPINEHLYTQDEAEERLNPYARIITNEARRRGIGVEILDADNGYFALMRGGRRIICRESLSEMTTAVAMSRCADKTLTAGIWEKEGLRVPRQQLAGTQQANYKWLRQLGRVVVKPVDGEQGKGITVDISDRADLDKAIELASQFDERVLIEEYVTGEDLRIIVINGQVVAAALRKPATIIGDGILTCKTLIEKQSRRRAAATGGESSIPIDEATIDCLRAEGYSLEDIPDPGEPIQVRRTANLHTGGTIHDCTASLHPKLKAVAIRAAEALSIPVVGLDLLVEDPSRYAYALIEANERPGLANHEPQPTAERFVDLLFPQTASDNSPE